MARPSRPKKGPAIRGLEAALKAALGDARRPVSRPARRSLIDELSARYRSLGRSLVWLIAWSDDEPIATLAAEIACAIFHDDELERARLARIRDSARKLLRCALADPELPALRERILRFAFAVDDDIPADLAEPGTAPRPEAARSAMSALPAAPPTETTRDADVDPDRALTELAELYPDTPRAIFAALQRCGLAGEAPVTPQAVRDGLMLGRALGLRAPSSAATLITITLAIAEHSDCLAVRDVSALDEVMALDPARGRHLMDGLANTGTGGVLADRALRLRQDPRFRAVMPRCHAAPVFSHALISTINGAGERTLAAFYHSGEGTLDALCFLLHETAGLREVLPIEHDGAELEQSLRDGPGRVALCPQERFIELVMDACDIHRTAQRPLPGLYHLYQSWLCPDPLPALPFDPWLGAFGTELMVRGPGLAADSAELAHDPLFAELGFSYPEALGAMIAARTAAKAGQTEAGRQDPITLVIDELAPSCIDRLARRIATNLEVLALSGLARRPLTDAAVRLWITLSEALTPAAEIPYLRALARRHLTTFSNELAGGRNVLERARERARRGRPGPEQRLFACRAQRLNERKRAR